MQEKTITATGGSCLLRSARPSCGPFCPCSNVSPARYVVVLRSSHWQSSEADVSWQLSEKWKGELVATGGLDVMMNKWLSRATLDVVGEGAFLSLTYPYYVPSPEAR